jgi:recombinational DNA repair protein RecT
VAYKNRKGPWLSDEDSMVEKTAAKAFLRPYAADSEGLAMALGNEFDDDYEPEPVIRNVEDRVSRVVENKVERMEKIAEKVEPEPQAEPVQEPVKAQKADEKDELF